MNGWSARQMPDLSGQVAIVTGANSGLGRFTARELARYGAEVVIACRDTGKGEAAAAEIRREVVGAALSVESLDLASLRSVRAFAERVAGAHPRIDLLVNNAGVMAPPRRLTEDGFESQLGTNHLGHYALTGLLLTALLAAPAPRVVTVSSIAHRIGRVNFDNLQGERRYNNWLAYGQSKLANLLFCFELQRRATAAVTPLLSTAAHPGYALTNLQTSGPARFYEKWLGILGNLTIAQSGESGALPTLYAATEQLPGATFVGPSQLGEVRGPPHIVSAAGRAYDEDSAARLWQVSAELTDVVYAWPT